MDELDRLRYALKGRYEVERELGRGGAAVVYLAWDPRHQRKVAIKVLRPDLTVSLAAERFLREIGIEARLQHPNILPLYDSGQAGGLLYYAMPYVEGESLRQRLEREKQLSIDDALRIATEVADALSYAHVQGVVHRDIKPENILLSGGHAVIADFGIARAISEAGGDRLTESGHTVGTPSYMSPEQAGGESDLDARTDIYALGCVLYEMLAGEPPFTGRSARAILARQMLEPPPPIEILRPSVPPPVAAAIEKALAKSPADRFGTAGEFSAALLAPSGEQLPRARRKRRPLHRVFYAALAVVAGLAGFAMWQAIQREGVDLDANKVVVFPLVDRTTDSGNSGAGWDVAIAIGAALEHTQPLKWIDGWSRLTEPVRQNPVLLTADRARKISRDRGARHYMDGVIRREEGTLSVVLRLHDALGDSLVAQETALGGGDNVNPPDLGLRAATQLLPKLLDPGRGVDLSPLTDRAPAAIALWIQGEREYRQSRFAQALQFYRRAVREDSLLVFAAVKGAQAASWEGRLSEAERLIELALRYEALLPRTYARLARGFGAYLAGNADSAVRHFQEALAENPEWSEAAMGLGETFYHLIPSAFPLDSLAEAWFLKAVRYDTAFTPPVDHLAEISLRRGDRDRGEAFIRRLREVGRDTTKIRRLALMLDCVRLGPGRPPWRAVLGPNVIAVFQAAKELSVAASQPHCAEEAARAILRNGGAPREYRWGALVILQGLLVAQRRDEEAVALIDSAVTAGIRGAMSLYIFNALAGARMESRAAEAEDQARRAAGQDYEKAQPSFRWLLGVWQAHRGDVAKAERIWHALADRAVASGERADQLLAASLAAHVALAKGDTADALTRLRSLAPTAAREVLAWDLAQPLSIERLLLARLLLGRGEYEEAYRVAAVFDHHEPTTYLTYLPASLWIRLRAAEALARPRIVSACRDRLLALGRSDILGGQLGLGFREGGKS